MRFSGASAACASLFLVMACSGFREPPDIEDDDGAGTTSGDTSSTTVTGVPTTGSTTTSGTTTSSSTGTGGGGGMGGAGGGGMVTPPSALYPYCGCINDRQLSGACTNCWEGSKVAMMGACEAQFADCATTTCLSMLQALESCGVPADTACIDAAFAIDPNRWDDVVAFVTCACEACPPINFCDQWTCP